MSDDNKEGAAEPVAWQGRPSPAQFWQEVPPDLLTFRRDVQKWEIRPLYATPPAVMPAAPSDAVLRGIYYSAHDALGLAEWTKRARAALSQTMQPQAGAEPVGWESASERYLADIIDRAPEPLRRLGEWLSQKLDEDEWKTAERYVLGAMESLAAAGEQAGAVARTELQAACFRWLLENCISEDGNGWLRIEYSTARQGDGHKDWAHWLTVDVAGEMGMEVDDLAAPGAAIAARETNATIIYGALSDQARQRTSRENIEDVLAALAPREEAPATPQAAIPAAPSNPVVPSIRDALVELVDLMQGVIDGSYESDSFTLQPARAALTQPTTVQQAEPDEKVREAGRAWAYAEGHEYPGESADAYLQGHRTALKTAQTTAGGNGEGE